MLNYIISHSGKFGRMLHTLKVDRKGVAALEYGILAAVVAVGATVAVPALWGAIAAKFTAATGAIAGL